MRDFDYLIVEPDEAAAAVGAGCERVAVVEGKPSLRWREWVGAVGSVEALRALVKEWRGRESWEHWLVKTEPVSVLVHCQTGGGGGRGGMKRAKPTPKAQDLSEWTADE